MKDLENSHIGYGIHSTSTITTLSSMWRAQRAQEVAVKNDKKMKRLRPFVI